ncbi:hypothetical protein HPB48_015000 [Haemaphysalis longicornis]|uniref:Non-structural maintenance of chromosomes element 4 n=1 Tax=Haemaphysalis longicornis TaxID=44386 RepID=A0A9J6FUD2_HAELO|nr:hypothetical protein HPB48_015000 [Haemaphysalis longicornis]
MTMSEASQDEDMVDGVSCSQQSTEGNAEESEMRRKVRRAYYKLIDDAQKDSGERSEELHRTLDKAQELFGRVTRLPEAVLDSKLMVLMGNKGRERMRAVPIDFTTFDAEEFAVRVRGSVFKSSGTGPVNVSAWARLGRLGEGMFQSSVPLWYLYGTPGELPPKVRQPRTRRQDQDTVDRAPTVPTQVRSVQQTNQGDDHGANHQDSQAPHLLYTLAWATDRCTTLSFAEPAIVLPRPARNIFHLSLSDQRGPLLAYSRRDGLLVVEPVSTSESSNCRRCQQKVFAMTLSMKQWQEAVKALGITEP